MRYNVTFQSTITPVETEPPYGEELALSLVASLKDAGVDVELVDSYEDYAWWLEGGGSKPRPWILVGYIDDDVHQWLLQINSGTSWLQRLRGKSDAEQRDALALAVHGLLSESDQFTNVRWHVGEYSDEGWWESPGFGGGVE